MKTMHGLAAGMALAGLLALGGTRTPARGIWLAPQVAFADDATIMVSTGGAEPIEFGQQEPPGTVGETVHVWDWSKGTKSRPLSAKVKGSFAVAPDGTWIVTCDGRRIDLASGAETPLPLNGGKSAYSVVVSPNGKWLVVVALVKDDEYRAELRSAGTGELRCALPRPWFGMFKPAFSPDGREVVLMGHDKTLRRCDARTGEVLGTFESQHTNSLGALAVSPDGRWLLSSGNGETFLHEYATGKLKHRLEIPSPHQSLRHAYSVAVSADGKWAAGGGIQNLTLWNLETGAVAKVYPNESGNAKHLRFAADGKELVMLRGGHIQGFQNGDEKAVRPSLQRWPLP